MNYLFGVMSLPKTLVCSPSSRAQFISVKAFGGQFKANFRSVSLRTPGKQVGIEVVIVRTEALNPGLVVAYLVLNYLV